MTDHDDNIFSLAVLPNNMFASASGDKTIRIWDQAELECIRILTGHTVSGLAVVENEYLVSISDDTAIVWDSYSFSKIASVNSTAVNGFFSVCTYFDYSFITSDYEGRIQIWSQSLESSETLKGHSYTVTDLAVLNNGYLASAYFDGTLIIWNSSFHQLAKEKHSEAILALSVFQNGSLISCSSDGTCKTWDTDHYILIESINKEK